MVFDGSGAVRLRRLADPRDIALHHPHPGPPPSRGRKSDVSGLSEALPLDGLAGGEHGTGAADSRIREDRLPHPRTSQTRAAARRSLASGIAGAALLVATAGDGPAAAAGILHLRCTNPFSGTSWPIIVDLDHDRVDSLAATITLEWISWHDPERGYFDLERATGRLQLRNASSTGGYFLHYTCRSG
jgi:hypothetical protein